MSSFAEYIHLSAFVQFLLINQTFHPDLTATGQYLAELAVALVARGHEVSVVTSRRAYDNPTVVFPKRDVWQGINIYRVWSTGFGKSAAWRRCLDFASFMLLCCLRLMLLRRHEVVVTLTSPPLVSVLGGILSRLRGAKFVYWVMDFNPDEAIAAGWLRRDSFAARMLDALSRFSLREARRIIAMDRFMEARITAKGVPTEKIVVAPPWPLEGVVQFDPVGREEFRRTHDLQDKFVVMYSGNHSPVHPLRTLLSAADALRADQGIMFCFVGGGSEWRTIKEHWAAEEPISTSSEPAGGGCVPSTTSHLPPTQPNSANIKCLPYQPLDRLSASLSAADIHVVVMGQSMVGLVHPCKIYNILLVGTPVLYIGPAPSHVSEILDQAENREFCCIAAHDDVAAVVAHIRRIRAASSGRVGKVFYGAKQIIMSRAEGLSRVVNALEAA